jgi:hypothetical protein
MHRPPAGWNPQESCLACQRMQPSFKVAPGEPRPVVYKDVKLDCGHRMDLVFQEAVVAEISAVNQVS